MHGRHTHARAAAPTFVDGPLDAGQVRRPVAGRERRLILGPVTRTDGAINVVFPWVDDIDDENRGCNNRAAI